MANKDVQIHGRTGLAKQASTAAFTTARAVTSHVRRRYHSHYHGKYRFAPLVFGFDLTLLGLATILVGLNIYLFTVLPAPLDAFRLDLITSELRTVAPVALEARVTPVGAGPHVDVRLFWKLPAGTEILESDPPIGDDGSAYFGSIPAGQSSSSRLVVRLLTSQDVATFSFRVQDRETVVNGLSSRRISGSGLVFEPVVPLASVQRDVPVLYRIQNDTNLPIEDVRVVGGASLINGEAALSIERLEPYEERMVAFRPSATNAVLAEAFVENVAVLRRREAYALLASDPTGVRLELDPSDGTGLSLIAQADRPASVAIWHPGLIDEDHLRVVEVPTGRSEIKLPVQASDDASVWYAFPFAKRNDGNALGALSVAPISTPFTIHAAGRYYAASGDQIGIGPLPPRVGETTKLWIGLRLGPTTSDLSGVRVRAKLAPGVRVTGRDALPDGGSFSQTDTELIWNVGFLPADADGAGASFEIQLTPTETQKGSVPALIELVTAEALDVRANLPREVTDGYVDLNLPEDELGKNLGTVE
ncbi:hypothetical protein M0Q28_05190 [Patescibacteria group bacterium]|jgi:hypothetical protein|nr:hypothetical protein [Patescibacteria group bacterium]